MGNIKYEEGKLYTSVDLDCKGCILKYRNGVSGLNFYPYKMGKRGIEKQCVYSYSCNMDCITLKEYIPLTEYLSNLRKKYKGE